ncbi:MAG: cytochrome c biogenesis protein CcsA [Desulfovibrio sp.]|nr:cytochrome c biogenesis protein CcsA [Desulfovibrio sp.]
MTSFLLGMGALGVALCQWLIFCYAPLEATMGLSQKIFYCHLPLAWWGLFAFFLVFLASIRYLWKREPRVAAFALACGEVGELLAVLTVGTGMIWGKAAWGVWWTWDPRLTTALVLCFIYAGWLLLHRLDLAFARRALLCAVTGIIAFLDVPLVFVSSRIWRSIHPAVFTQSGAGLAFEMLGTVLACIVCVGLFCAGLIRLRYQQLKISTRLDDLL